MIKNCCIRDETLDEDGFVTVGRAIARQWGNTGCKMNGGITRTEYEKRVRKALRKVAQIAQWKTLVEGSRVRNAADGVRLLAQYTFNSRRTSGHSEYNYNSVDTSKIEYASQDKAKEWGMNEDDPFIHFKDWHTGYGGDDAAMSKWPKEALTISVNGVKGLIYKNGWLAHSRYAHVATLVSSQGCHSTLVRNQTLKQLSQLSKLKKFKIPCETHQCWILMKHDYESCFDWVYEEAICGYFGHSSTTPLHGITEFIDGQPASVKFDHKVFDHLLLNPISPVNYNIDFDEWQSQHKYGYVLTNTRIYKEMCRIAHYAFVEEYQAIRNKGNEYKFNDAKFVKDLRRDIASKNAIYCVNDEMFEWEYNQSTDLFHAFNKYCFNHVKTLGIESHCSSKYEFKDSKRIFKQFS